MSANIQITKVIPELGLTISVSADNYGDFSRLLDEAVLEGNVEKIHDAVANLGD